MRSRNPEKWRIPLFHKRLREQKSIQALLLDEVTCGFMTNRSLEIPVMVMWDTSLGVLVRRRVPGTTVFTEVSREIQKQQCVPPADEKHFPESLLGDEVG